MGGGCRLVVDFGGGLNLAVQYCNFMYMFTWYWFSYMYIARQSVAAGWLLSVCVGKLFSFPLSSTSFVPTRQFPEATCLQKLLTTLSAWVLTLLW